MSDKCKHCWHDDGVSVTTLMTGQNSGSDGVKCCRCGALGSREWREASKRIRGHGSHISTTEREYGEVRIAQPYVIGGSAHGFTIQGNFLSTDAASRVPLSEGKEP